MILQLQNIFRIRSWWNYIIPPVLGAVYFVVVIKEADFASSISWIILWFISIIGTAVYGFALNDIFDATADKKAGKTNRMSALPIILQACIIALSLCVAILPLFFLNVDMIVFVFLGGQLLLLSLYSVPPFRLKQNKYLSVICDSLYSGLIFIVAVIIAGNLQADAFNYTGLVFFIAAITLLFRGVRNILIHQLTDAENDQKSGINSIVLQFGKDWALKIINTIVVAEVVGIFAFTTLLSLEINSWMALIIPGFLLYFLLKRFDKQNKNKSNLFFIQILNDFYEDVLPLVFLIFLCINDLTFLVLLAIHVIIFQNKVVWLFSKKIFFFIYGIIYRKAILWLYFNPLKWLYYKAFCNKHVKRFIHKSS